jgi:hypothetical protein
MGFGIATLRVGPVEGFFACSPCDSRPLVPLLSGIAPGGMGRPARGRPPEVADREGQTRMADQNGGVDVAEEWIGPYAKAAIISRIGAEPPADLDRASMAPWRILGGRTISDSVSVRLWTRRLLGYVCRTFFEHESAAVEAAPRIQPGVYRHRKNTPNGVPRMHAGKPGTLPREMLVDSTRPKMLHFPRAAAANASALLGAGA